MIKEIDFPRDAQIFGREQGSYFRDAFKVNVSKDNLEAGQVYHAIFGYLPKPVQVALSVRNTLMKPFGFAASNTKMSLPLEDIKAGTRAGFLLIDSVSASEVVCSSSETNMDMWLSVLKISEREFAVSTLVNLKTRTGRAYMACIKPFHKIVARYCIRQALKAGRL